MSNLFKRFSEGCENLINVLPYNHNEDLEFPPITDDDLIFIDQEPANEFNLNEAGWIRNDISAFEYAENEQIASQILSRFEEVKQDDVFKGMTYDEMFDACIPRRATTDPVTYSKYLQNLAEIQYKVAKRAEEEEQAKIKEREFSNKQINEAENEKSAIADSASSAMASKES